MTIEQVIAFISAKGFIETSGVLRGSTEYRCFQREKDRIDQRFRFPKEITHNKVSILFESKPLFKWQLDMVGILDEMSVDKDGIIHGFISRKT